MLMSLLLWTLWRLLHCAGTRHTGRRRRAGVAVRPWVTGQAWGRRECKGTTLLLLQMLDSICWPYAVVAGGCCSQSEKGYWPPSLAVPGQGVGGSSEPAPPGMQGRSSSHGHASAGKQAIIIPERLKSAHICIASLLMELNLA